MVPCECKRWVKSKSPITPKSPITTHEPYILPQILLIPRLTLRNSQTPGEPNVGEAAPTKAGSDHRWPGHFSAHTRPSPTGNGKGGGEANVCSARRHGICELSFPFIVFPSSHCSIFGSTIPLPVAVRVLVFWAVCYDCLLVSRVWVLSRSCARGGRATSTMLLSAGFCLDREA